MERRTTVNVSMEQAKGFRVGEKVKVQVEGEVKEIREAFEPHPIGEGEKQTQPKPPKRFEVVIQDADQGMNSGISKNTADEEMKNLMETHNG